MPKTKRPLTHFDRVHALVPMFASMRRRHKNIIRANWITFARKEYACSEYWAVEAIEHALELVQEQIERERKNGT